MQSVNDPDCNEAGHSLGGAMANLADVDIIIMMQWPSLKVYTVGPNRVVK